MLELFLWNIRWCAFITKFSKTPDRRATDIINKMIGVLGHDSALEGYSRPGQPGLMRNILFL